MKQLICEMCGSKDLLKQDGVFVCQSCGCKYSVEEARKMMIEGTVDVSGSTVKVDNSGLIDNYLQMAENALNSNNNAEAESYCNKIIEIEPTNYKAWLMKGQAAGWQSTLQNSRLAESISAFVKAFENAPPEEQEKVLEKEREQIIDLAKAMITLRANRFVKWPDEEESNGFLTDIRTILLSLGTFIGQTHAPFSLSDLMKPIVDIIQVSIANALPVIFKDYNGDPNDPNNRTSDYAFRKFIERVDIFIQLIKATISLCPEDTQANVLLYEMSIGLNEKAIDACSWDYKYTDYGKSWYKNLRLTDEAKALRRKQNEEFRAEIAKIKATEERKKKEEQKRKNEEYWKNHAAEKRSYEEEKVTNSRTIRQHEESVRQCDAKIKAIKEDLKQQVAGEAELGALKKQQSDIELQIKDLGVFAGKQKKQLREQSDRLQPRIDELEMQVKPLREQLEKFVQDKVVSVEQEKTMLRSQIQSLEQRNRYIDNELTRER